ncbi:MAG: CoA-binding protein [Pseudomonadota bacterium]
MRDPTDEVLSKVLTETKSIAVLGASPNEARASNRVTGFLVSKGFYVVAVNPGHTGKVINGAQVVASLADLPEPVDMVDVFRASDHLAKIAEEVLTLPWRPKVFWTQLGVRDDKVAARLEGEGITVIQDRCPAIEMPRLGL